MFSYHCDFLNSFFYHSQYVDKHFWQIEISAFQQHPHLTWIKPQKPEPDRKTHTMVICMVIQCVPKLLMEKIKFTVPSSALF